MNKFNKIVLTIAGICAALSLIISLGIFIINIGHPFQAIHKSVDTCFGPFNVNLGDGQFQIGFSDIPDTGSVYSPSCEYTADGDINALEVEWTSGSVEFVVGGDTLTFTESASRSISENEALKWQVKDGVLKIYFSTLTSFNLPSKKLVITVPESMASAFNNISANLVSADMTVSGFNMDKLTAYSVSGDIKVIDSRIGTCDFETTSGRVDAENCTFGEISSHTVSGRVTLDLNCCPDYMGIDTVSASSFVFLPSESDFTLKTDTVSGSVSIDFPATIYGKSYTVGDGDCQFKFESVSGSLNVSKK